MAPSEPSALSVGVPVANVTRGAFRKPQPEQVMPAGLASTRLAPLPATSVVPSNCDAWRPVTCISTRFAFLPPSAAFACTDPPICVCTFCVALLRITPLVPTLNCEKRLFDTPAAFGATMLTTCVPLPETSSVARAAAPGSAAIGSVACALATSGCMPNAHSAANALARAANQSDVPAWPVMLALLF